MTLPIRTNLDDIRAICSYLVNKPTGASLKEAKAVLESARLRPQKIAAAKFWGFLDENDGRMKLTEKGRAYAKSKGDSGPQILGDVIRTVRPYAAIVERAAHRNEDSVSAADVAAHWHNHFKEDSSSSDEILNEQAITFFQVGEGAHLGALIVGRKGAPTRFAFDNEAIKGFVNDSGCPSPPAGDAFANNPDESAVFSGPERVMAEAEFRANGHDEKKRKELGQGIFIAHGKNKRPMEQLKQILEQFKIPYKVAVGEPNLGRPIGTKVREVMESCNCAILIFTADEEFNDKHGNTIWRPSENVVFELGAAGYLYDRRIVIMKEEGVSFPSNFKDIGYISFGKDALDAKAMDILKELIGFQMVKVST